MRTYPNGHTYSCWLNAEDSAYLEQLVKHVNKEKGPRPAGERASVGGVCAAIVRRWIDERKDETK